MNREAFAPWSLRLNKNVPRILSVLYLADNCLDVTKDSNTRKKKVSSPMGEMTLDHGDWRQGECDN